MSTPLARRLAAGMAGGGAGADIGRTHRCAMRLDDRFELQAGVFGGHADRSATLATEQGVPADRAHGDYRQMARTAAARPDGVDVVAVATPNDSHFEIARAFLEAGISGVGEAVDPRRRHGGGAGAGGRGQWRGAGGAALLLRLRHGASRRPDGP